MKKFAIGVLSLMMMLGCVCLASCGSKVVLSCDVDSVEIYTNDENASNYGSADVSFSISNGSSGAYVEVTNGTNLVTTSTPTQKTDGSYTFKISAVGLDSGEASVKITSLDDSKQAKEITVYVNTKVTYLSTKDETSTRISKYVVKGEQGSAKGTDLSSDSYLDFTPVTANVANVTWAIVSTNSTYTVSADGQQLSLASGENAGTVVTEISDGKLFAYSSYALETITLQATCNGDSSVSTTVEFYVISDSSITTLTADGKNVSGGSGEVSLISEGAATGDDASFEIKFNGDDTDGVVTGTISVETDYDVSISLAVYRVSGSTMTYLGDTESNKFLRQLSETQTSGTYSYIISVDAISDDSAATYMVFFEVQYDDFEYSVSTKDYGSSGTGVLLSAAYKVMGVELYHTENGTDNFISDGEEINVYSSYSTTSGYLISVILTPTSVDLDDNTFTIQIDASASGENAKLAELLSTYSLTDFVTFIYGGRTLTFSKSGDVYTSTTTLKSGAVVYVLANSAIPTETNMYEGLKIDFVPNSDANCSTSVYANLYSITSAGTLDAIVIDSSSLFVSSSSSDSGTSTVTMRVYGFTSASGFSVSAETNSHFSFSSVSEVATGTDAETNEVYVDVSFTVTLLGNDFEDEVKFTLSHVTGKESGTFLLFAFVPLTSATVVNASSSSAGVYDNQTASQSYYLSGDTLEEDSSNDTTLSRVYVEAGTALSLSMTYQTLSENGVTFAFLLDENNLYVDDGNSTAIEKVVSAYSTLGSSLTDDFASYFTITTSRLTVTSQAFRGFVFVYFNGYDSQHQEVTRVRIFEIVSFFGVNYLSSIVKSQSLNTLETLSERDADLASVSVTVSFRLDGVTASHLDLSKFTFTSSAQGDFSESGSILFNDYYQITSISLGSTLTFKITALSTCGQGAISDRLTISYDDSDYGITRSTYILLSISDVVRVESVEWINETEDGEIYLNLTSSDSSEKVASIVTNVAPSSASNTALTYVYSVSSGSEGALSITQNSAGNTFTLKVASGTVYGSVGTLYILPQDMVKVVDNERKVLYYTFYDANGNGEWDADDDDEALTANYISIGSFGTIYSHLTADVCTCLSGTTYYANFFVNLDGEQVFYSDFLLAIDVTLADGLSQDTAIRVYNATQFKAIDTAKYYEIMNDISLSGWSGFSSGVTTLSGMIFGADSSVTISLLDNGEMLISEISNTGAIADLTFVGNVTSKENAVGFVVGTNRGTISNVTIDVLTTTNDGQTVISPSTLTASGSTYVGGIAGINHGTISDSYVLGMSISAPTATYTGGIAGESLATSTISSCGVEFYNYETDDTQDADPNTIYGGEYVGGIVGLLSSSATLTQSYAYAHVLSSDDSSDSHSSSDVISSKMGTADYVGLFAGEAEEGASASLSFAFLGDLTALSGKYPVANSEMGMSNSYYSYYDGSEFVSKIYNTSGSSQTLSESNNTVTITLSSVWATGSDIDSNVNFGFVHLKDIYQTLEVDVESLVLTDVTSANGNYTKLLALQNLSGILFNYKLTSSTETSAQASALSALNTISLADMFLLSSDETGETVPSALSDRQTRSLLVSSSISNVTVSTNSIQINDVTSKVFTLTVLSKVDLSNSQTFSFVVLESMPSVVTTLSGETISDGQTLLVQKGSTQNLIVALDNTIYLNGTEFTSTSSSYKLELGDVENSVSTDTTEYISVSLQGQNLLVEGKTAHNADSNSTALNVHIATTTEVTNATSSLTQTLIDSKIASTKTKKIDLTYMVYNGATSLSLASGTSLYFYPSETLRITAYLATDSTEDNIVLSLAYGGVSVVATSSTDNSATFEVDDNLTLEVTWTNSYDTTNEAYKYVVIVQVADSSLAKLSQVYEDLVLTITAKTNSLCTQSVTFTLQEEPIGDVSVYAYSISSKQIRSGRTYYSMSTISINALSPASDAILAVIVTPAYAQMDYFDITYSSSATGALIVSKLAENSLYGFCVTSTDVVQTLTNGIRVRVDKSGTGIYYFRLYVLATFDTDSDVELTVTFYKNDEAIEMCTYSLAVDYLESAQVLVNGDSSALLAKGSTATVSISVDVGTTIGNPFLQNVYSGISIIGTTETVTSSTRTITATLKIDVDASLQSGDTGVFYVSAMVSRTMNGVLETKTTSATVYLVDFALDTGGVTLSTDTTYSYNGTTYDAYISYIGATGYLTFDYTFNPQTYTSGSTAEEIAAIKELTALREQFAQDGYYADSNAGYYINYEIDSTTGEAIPLSIKQTLSTVNSDGSTSPIYNSVSGAINTNTSYFDMEESTNADLPNAMVVTGNAMGSKLMMLTTTIYFENTTFYYNYYFLVVIQAWTDEDNPTPIYDQQDFEDMLNGNYDSDDFILMNDIELEDYTPASTTNIDTFDGNGYVIHLNSFAEQTGSSVSYALFDEVTEGTTLKNVKVNVYEGGQISIDYSQQSTSKVAGFAITNNGIIYNCEVVSFKSSHQDKTLSTNGIVVTYTNGENMDAVTFGESMPSGVSTQVAGFVITNNSSITNSRVGGEELQYVEVIGSAYYLSTRTLGTFTITGQSNVSGFVSENTGTISASFAKNVQINNMTQSSTATTAGFANSNSGSIFTSYVEGIFDDGDDYVCTGTNISAYGIVGGFVYSNSGTINNSYSNIAITYVDEDGIEGSPTYVAGFVYENTANGTISTCYTACQIDASENSQMYFSGISIIESTSSSSGTVTTSKNLGTITNSYYLSASGSESTTQTKITTGVQGLSSSDIAYADENIYGFSFTSDDSSTNGIWLMNEHGITLASANNIAISNRYSVTLTSGVVNFYYNSSLINSKTLRAVDVSLGSVNNPIIIRSAEEFAKATGAATTTEISSYKKYYTETTVSGTYRLVSDIDMSDIDEDTNITLTTTTKTFTGSLDGNGFTMQNINLGSETEREAYGLFAKMDGAVVMNVDLTVSSVSNAKAYVVGTLAGVAIDTRLIEISVTPSNSTTSVTSSSIFGGNIVGGIVGILYGDSVMFNIEATNVLVDSSYNKLSDATTSNVSGLLSRLSTHSDTSTYAQKLSYAGALVGFVSNTCASNTNTSVYSLATYSEDYNIADYSIVSVKVTGTVYVYGEIVGGLFGYVGSTTYIYDAGIELDSGSYIISKNLYAGGLVGESYGGLFGVYSQYDANTQEDIENGETSYYSGSSVEHGQTDIFSSKKNSYDMPQYIGGIAGYMGGGYLSAAYSKLNVISDSTETNSLSTTAVGGIVGKVGSSLSQFTLSFAKSQPSVDVLFLEVYASGDVYSATGKSGGIVGEIDYSVVAMKNVMAMNYYSYSGSTLSEDESITVLRGESEDTAESLTYMIDHSAIVGTGSVTSFYVLSKDDEVNEIVGSKDYLTYATTYTTTVGGYNSVTIGSNTVYLRMFGFENYFEGAVWSSSCILSSGTNAGAYFCNESNVGAKLSSADYTDAEDGISLAVLLAQGISDFSSSSDAYVVFVNYFLENGWSVNNWTHEQDSLFPTLELSKDLVEYVYWDATIASTKKVLDAYENNKNVEIIVRGRTSDDELGLDYADINVTALVTALAKIDETHYGKYLTNLTTKGYLFADYGGTMISVSEYSTSSGMTITEMSYEIDYSYGNATYTCSINNGSAGGTADGNTYAGLIVTTSLFKEFSGVLQSLDIYMCGTDDVTGSVSGYNISYRTNLSNSSSISYSLISDSDGTKDAEFNKVNLVLNHNVTYAVSKVDDVSEMAKGILGGSAKSVTIYSTSITARAWNSSDSGSATTAATVTYTRKSDAAETGAYGLLFGSITQESTTNSMYLYDISVNGSLTYVITTDDSATDATDATELYVGSLAGRIEKGSGDVQKIYAYVSVIDNLTIDIKAKTTNLYVGGSYGYVSSLDAIRLNSSTGSSGVEIVLEADVTSELYAGLVFGEITGGSTITSNDTIVAKGSIYEKVSDGLTAENSYIGGLAGYSDSVTSVVRASINLSVWGSASSQVVYSKNSTSYTTSPFTAKGNVYVGGLFGTVAGGTPEITGSVSVTGTVEVYGNNNGITLGVGGLIGFVQNTVTITAQVTSGLNVSVESAVSCEVKACVGGIVGYVNADGIEVAIGDATAATLSSVSGNTIANVSNLIYGGAIGYVESTSATISVTNFVYSGALRVWGTRWNSSDMTNPSDLYIYAGGVIGKNEIPDSPPTTYNTISNCLTYGDVFVIYGSTSGVPNSYYFGGIMAAGAYYNIYGCVSLMSNFNTGYADISSGSLTGSYSVGAITGTGADGDNNNYGQECLDSENNSQEPNYYSSAVCMTYQAGTAITTDGKVKSIDLFYGTTQTDGSYVGYFLNTYSTDAEYEAAYQTYCSDYSSMGILSVIDEFFGNYASSFASGTKLNPVELNKTVVNTTDGIKFGENTYGSLGAYITTLSSGTNGITWFAVTEDLEFEYSSTSALFDDMSNAVLVGNGFTFSITDSRSVTSSTSSTAFGGVANTMGGATTSTTYTFQAISGLVIEFDNDSFVEIEGSSTSNYGGIAGSASSGSIIYGVSVSGEIYVGGTVAVRLASMVGYLTSGMITDSYSDANIYYCAVSGGNVSGIAFANPSTVATIKNTYSSGLITDYVGVPVYTFDYSANTDLSVVDSYTITQITYLDASTGVELTRNTSDEPFSRDTTLLHTTSSPTAMSYSSTTLLASQNFVADSTEKTTFYSWEYAPFVNYGYASHPIGWLKNSTAYVQTQTNSEDYEIFNGGDYASATTAVREYSYSQTYTNNGTLTDITYGDFLKNFLGSSSVLDGYAVVLGVFNVAKFEDMISILSKDNLTDSTKYKKFVLEYDLNMSSFSSSSYGIDLGTSTIAVYIDGNNRTLDFSSATDSTLFGEVYGTIENLRLTDMTVSGVATLANTVKGSGSTIQNITVTGDLTATDSTAGGVVATLTEGATAIGIESLVNVTSGSSSYIIGGVFGEVTDGARVLFSSSSGQVITTNAYSESDAKTFKAYKSVWSTYYETDDSENYDFSETEGDDTTYYNYYRDEDGEVSSEITGYEYVDITANAIAGGVVGYLNGGSVDYSYNAGSVLANYTNETTTNSIAGGIVGYAVQSSDSGASATTISNSINVALVGAGNYSSTPDSDNSDGYSVAGGIFGYGYNLASSSVSSCFNDGAVQAYGYQGSEKDTDWKIVVDGPHYDESGVTASSEFAASTYSYSISGATASKLTDAKRESMDYYAYKVGTLQYYYTLKYNPGDYRHVYAFGIGYVYSSSSAVTSDCETSTDNIENDGNIGEYWVTQTMTFDRQAVLDNDDGTLDYWGKFNIGTTYDSDDDAVISNDDSSIENNTFIGSASGGYYISGYDAYGFPVRIYNTDTISRIYMYTGSVPSSSTATSYLKSMYSGLEDYGEFSGFKRLTYNGSSWSATLSSSENRKIYSSVKGGFVSTILNFVVSPLVEKEYFYFYHAYVNDIYDSYAEAYLGDNGYLGWGMFLGTYDGTNAYGSVYTKDTDVGERDLIDHKTGLIGNIDSYDNSEESTAYSSVNANSMWEDILMEDTSTYYVSVSFDSNASSSNVYGYDALLANGSGSGIDVFNSCLAESSKTKFVSAGSVSVASESTANTNVENIDAKLENSTENKNIKIGGVSTAIVYSSNGLSSATAPYEYTIVYNLTLDEDQTISNVSVTSNVSGSNIVVASISSYKDGALTVKAYCNQPATGNFSISYDITSTEEIILGNNNVSVNGDDLIIEFADDFSDGNYSWVEKLFTCGTVGDSNYPDAKITTMAVTLSDGTTLSLYDYFNDLTDLDFTFATVTNDEGNEVLQLTLIDALSSSKLKYTDSNGATQVYTYTITDNTGATSDATIEDYLNNATFSLGVTTVSDDAENAFTVFITTLTDTYSETVASTYTASASSIVSTTDEDDTDLEYDGDTDLTYLVGFKEQSDGSVYLLFTGTSGSGSDYVETSKGTYFVFGVNGVFSISKESGSYVLRAYDGGSWTAVSSLTFTYGSYKFTLTSINSGENIAIRIISTTGTLAYEYISDTTYYSDSSGTTAVAPFKKADEYDSTLTYYSDNNGTEVTNKSTMFEKTNVYSSTTTYYTSDGEEIDENDIGDYFTQASGSYVSGTYYYNSSHVDVTSDVETGNVDIEDCFTFCAYVFKADIFYTFVSGVYYYFPDLSSSEIGQFTSYLVSAGVLYYADYSGGIDPVTETSSTFSVVYSYSDYAIDTSASSSATYLGYTFYGKSATLSSIAVKVTDSWAYSLSYSVTADSTTSGTEIVTKTFSNSGDVESSTTTIFSNDSSISAETVSVSITRVYEVEYNESGVAVYSKIYHYQTNGTDISVYGKIVNVGDSFDSDATYILYKYSTGEIYEGSTYLTKGEKSLTVNGWAEKYVEDTTNEDEDLNWLRTDSGYVFYKKIDTTYTASTGTGLEYGIYDFTSASGQTYNSEQVYFKLENGMYTIVNFADGYYYEKDGVYFVAMSYDENEQYYSLTTDANGNITSAQAVTITPDLSSCYVAENVLEGLDLDDVAYYSIFYSYYDSENSIEYNYDYRVYTNDVELYIINSYDESEEDATLSIYVKSEGTWKSYSQKSNTVEIEYTTQIRFEDEEDGTITNTYTYNITTYSSMTSSNTTLTVIFEIYVQYMDEFNLIFSSEASDYLVQTSKNEYTYSEGDEKKPSITLYYTSIDSTKKYEGKNYVTYTFDGENVYSSDNEVVISNSDYGAYVYNVTTSESSGDTLTFSKSSSTSGTITYEGSGYTITYDSAKKETVDIIIFGDDIHSTMTYTANTCTIIGNGTFIKYTSETSGVKSSIFGNNKATIKGLSVVAVVSLRTLDYNSSAVVEVSSNTSHYLSVTTYGSIRNVGSYNSKASIYTIASGTMKLTGTSRSYVTIVGLDADQGTKKSGDGVVVKLYDLASGFSGSGTVISHSILIAGDGRNGKYGIDGTATNQNAYTGTNGNSGGSVVLTASSTSSGVTINSSAIARAGTAGVGGSGGDGLNGYEVALVTSEKYSYNGGKGGNSGSTGSAGTLTNTGSGSGNSELSTRNAIVGSIMIYKGNSGIGRFWRVYWDDSSEDTQILANSPHYASGIGFGSTYKGGTFYQNGEASENTTATNLNAQDSDLVWRIRATYKGGGKITFVTVFAGVTASLDSNLSAFSFDNSGEDRWNGYIGSCYFDGGYFYSWFEDRVEGFGVSPSLGASDINVVIKAARVSWWQWAYSTNSSMRTTLWANFTLGSFTKGAESTSS